MSVNYFHSPQVPWGEPAPVALATDEQVRYEPDGSARVTVTVTNRSTGSLSDLSVALAVPGSSGIEPAVRRLEVLPAGQTQQLAFAVSFAQAGARATESTTTVTWPAPVPGELRLRSPLRLSCADGATSPVGVTYVDSQETIGENGSASNAIDGDPDTIWHTQWRGSAPGYPHEIQVDLGAASSVCAFRYLPRQNGVNGTVDRYDIYLSSDGNTWGQPIASGRFGNTGQGEKWVPLPETGARYVRFVTLSEINGGPWTSAAEIGVDKR
jgi:hexosaminidase